MKGTTTDVALFQHTRGAALLIEHRGPDKFVSDFDRALLTSHLPLLVSTYSDQLSTYTLEGTAQRITNV